MELLAAVGSSQQKFYLLRLDLRVVLDVLKLIETVSVKSGEGCEQVLAVVILINHPVDVKDYWLVAQAGSPIWPPEPQVVTMNLNECAVIAVPDDAFDPAFRTLLEPGAQLLEVHWWRVSDPNAPV